MRNVFNTMTLHTAKNDAILQWCNSLCSYNVSKIDQLCDGKLLCDVIHSVFKATPVKDNESISHAVEGLEEETVIKHGPSHDELTESFDENAIILERYKFLQNFIDDTYNLKSSDIINYEECKSGNELELAKVAVFILSSIVKHFLECSNSQVNTLTLLEHRVQEDIQECLSLLLQNPDKTSKEETEQVLSKQAKYKISPRKRCSFGTPRRCSSKYKSVVEEDVFNYSPLKSFLESPQFRNQIFQAKDEELLKTRKILHAEEEKVDDLEFEVEKLRKLLVAKEKENSKLKNDVQNLRSKEHEANECINCKKFEKDMELHNKHLKKMKVDIQNMEELLKEKEEEMEHYRSKLESLRTKLDGKRKSDNHIERVIMSKKEFQLLESQRMIDKLQDEIQEIRMNYKKDVSLLEEKLAVAKVTSEKQLDDTSVKGENVGSMIEDENKLLRTKLQQAEIKIQNLEKYVEVITEGSQSVAKTVDLPLQDGSDILRPGILSSSNLSEYHDHIVDKSPESIKTGFSRSVHPDVISCDAANAEFKHFDNTVEAVKEYVPVSENTQITIKDSDKPCDMRELGDEKVSDLETYYPNNNYSPTNSSDFLKQLGCTVDTHAIKCAAKILCELLKEMFVPNGSNGFNSLRTLGDWEKNLKTDEDYVSCLLYMKESLLKFHNNGSKENVLTEKLHNCDNDCLATLNQLKNEHEELKKKYAGSKKIINEIIKELGMKECDSAKQIIEILRTKLSNYEKFVLELKKKELDIKMLCQELELEKNWHKEAVSSNEVIMKHNKEMCNEKEELKSQIRYLSDKVATIPKFENQYTELLNEKNQLAETFQKHMKMHRDKILKFEVIRKELLEAIEYQRKKRMNLYSEKKSLEYALNEANIDKKELKSKIKEMEALNGKNTDDDDSVPSSQFLNPGECSTKLYCKKETKSQPKLNIVKEELVSPTVVKNEFHDNIKENKSQSLLGDSSYSGALFIKRSFILHTDDEESFLNHSSLAEITSEKEERLAELQRRNSVYKPHLRSSYAPEMQCMSPLNRNYFDLVKDPPILNSDTSTKRRHLFKVKTVTPVLSSMKKKRKISEVESDACTNINKTPGIPEICRQKLKNQSKFVKVLYRGNQDKKPNPS